ncbi:CLUMA_CG005070, isoform A [Clunio marinus]|uniref:CLUMA_CG005070, isoform A n=1 Tax=Clunio marinus TaxID=568069 RepID=A0A1J1HTS2_9DIPT|nr:CLUMA_CG005070, isoform A [Clunio marinus]
MLLLAFLQLNPSIKASPSAPKTKIEHNKNKVMHIGHFSFTECLWLCFSPNKQPSKPRVSIMGNNGIIGEKMIGEQ